MDRSRVLAVFGISVFIGASGSVARAQAPGEAPPEAPAEAAAQPPVAAPPAAPQAGVAVATPTASPAPNSVYAEGLGAGLAYSLNYERLVLDNLGIRAGFGYWGTSASATVNGQTAGASASFLTIPIT